MSRDVRKPDFCICENKDADQIRITAKLISVFVFATRIVQSLYFLNPKFQVSSHLLWLYSPVVSDLVTNPEDLFSDVAAQMIEGLKAKKIEPRHEKTNNVVSDQV